MVNFKPTIMLITLEEIEYKNHKYYQACIDFCEKYDQASFDPNYKSLPLSEFEPMVKRIFSRKPYTHS